MSPLPRRPCPVRRPLVISYSRAMRLPSTTPHPASLRAGSICSALVSASFMPLAVLLHQLSEVGVDSGLIPFAGCLYPRYYIRIEANGDGGFLRSIKLPDHGIRRDLANFRNVRQVDFTIRTGSQFPERISFLSR